MRSVSAVRISRRLCLLAALAAGCHPAVAQLLEMNEMPVYTIFNDTGEEGIAGSDMLDGDMSKVRPVGVEFDPPGYLFRLPDSTYVHLGDISSGLPNETKFLPTKIRWGGRKRELTDLQYARNSMLARDNFRRVLEELEPGVHQFVPVEIVWNDGSSAGEFYWFYPCVRLDGMDRNLTTHTLHREREWVHAPEGKYVINLNQVAGHHLWFDKRAMWHFPYVSEGFKQAMANAGVKGIGYHECESV
jgi:hypothetical protein